MDSLDYGIIDLLRLNARAGYGDIGEKIGLSASAVKRRVDRLVADGVIRGFTIQVDPAVAKDFARRAAREEGILVGISSGATLAAISQKLPDLPQGARVLGFNYDTGERYLSVADFLPEEAK